MMSFLLKFGLRNRSIFQDYCQEKTMSQFSLLCCELQWEEMLLSLKLLLVFAVVYALFNINFLLTLPDPQVIFPKSHQLIFPKSQECNLFKGKWVQDLDNGPLYGACTLNREEWTCYDKNMTSMYQVNSWRWKPENCRLPQLSSRRFLPLMRNKVIGFFGDSVIENFMVSLLCNLHQGGHGATMWDKKLLTRAYFPMFNFSVRYFGTTSFARFEYDELGSRPEDPLVKMDVDLRAWFDVVKECDVLVFNFQHLWADSVRRYNQLPCLALTGRTISYLKRGDDVASVKFWLTPSPIHNYRDCVSTEPLDSSELDKWRSRRFDVKYQSSIDMSNQLEEQLALLTKSVKIFNVAP